MVLDDNDDDNNTEATLNKTISAQEDIKIPCFQCNLVFSMSEFPAHQAVHQQGRQQEKRDTDFKCTECTMSFNTIENLINHMKVVHFSMWGAWSQFYNWNQMDQFGFPYMQTLVDGQINRDTIYAGSSYDPPFPSSSQRRWANTVQERERMRSRSKDRDHDFDHGRRHDHGHRHGRGHGHRHGGRFHSLHHRRKRSSSPHHWRHHGRHERFHRHSPDRFRRHSPSRPTLAELAIRREDSYHRRRIKHSPSFHGSFNSRSSSPVVIDLENENEGRDHHHRSYKDSSPFRNEPNHSEFPASDGWVVADSWKS